MDSFNGFFFKIYFYMKVVRQEVVRNFVKETLVVEALNMKGDLIKIWR